MTLRSVAAAGALLHAGGCSSPAEQAERLDQANGELTIHAPDASVNYFFGTSVTADTQTLVVGDYGGVAPKLDGNTAQRGQVHVYTRSGDIQEWQSLQVLKPDAITQSSEIHFGENVILKNNLLLISAHRDTGGSDAEEGAFYVYSRPGAGQSFTRVGKFTAPVPTAGQRFGEALATNGNFIAVGRGKEGTSPLVHVYRVSGNSVTYAYAIDMGFPALEVGITESGVLIARPAGPNLHAYHLQQNQAVPLGGTELLSGDFWRLRVSGNSFAAIDTKTATPRVLVGTADTARISSTTSFELPAGPLNLESLAYLENQHVIVANKDPVRPGLLKWERQGASWAPAGVLHAPPEAHAIGSNFGKGLTSTSEFVAAGITSARGKVIVLAPDANGVLDGAVFDQQQLLARDACGAQCGTQSFGSTQFGRHASIAGDVAAITTIELSTVATRESALHIYSRQGSTWQHSGQFFLGENQRARAVAVDSERVYVGHGTKAGPGGFSDGSVGVYERNANVWSRTATLTSTDGSVASTFIGENIAALGDTVALGTDGFVYIFQRDGSGAWTQTHKLPVTPVVSSTPIAYSVALSADYLVVGARLDSSVLTHQGAVFVYRRSDYALDQKITSVGSQLPDLEFGYAVAIHGSTIAAGSPNGSSGGFVEIFERTGMGTTPWQRRGEVRPQHGNDYRVGTSVSLTDTQLLIGAVGDPFTGAQGGAAYLVPRVGGSVDMSRARLLLPRDNGRGDAAAFGWAVQLSGSRAIVSAPMADVDASGDAGATYIFENLVDADGDGLFVSEDCNDTDGVHKRCSSAAANMSFEQNAPAWAADTGSFTYDAANYTDGLTSLRLNAGSPRLRGPSFSTKTLREVGTTLALDIKRATVNGNAVSLFMSAPAFGLYESLVGTIDISALPAGKWVTVSAPFTAQQRDILLRQNTDVRFHVAFNTGGPNLYVDRLHFSGTFETRLAPPPPTGPFSGTLNVTSDWGTGYCVTIRLNNAGTTPTAGWQLVVNPNGATMTSNWNAVFSGTDPISINSNQAWNSSVPAGATNHDVSAGFCANRPSGGTALPSITSATRL